MYFGLGSLYQDEPIITQHAWERFSERTDLSHAEIPAFVRNALRYGRSYSYYTGKARDYLLSKTGNGCLAIAYSGLVLVFSPTNTLVTVYELPDWWLQWWAEQLDHAKTPKRLTKYHAFDKLFLGLSSMGSKKKNKGRTVWR